ncbi:MAG: hypothetical protein JWR67_3739 [Mucilaginibacter sp.]|nr:hypothetical protein [Mucilaginibacter sp.]
MKKILIVALFYSTINLLFFGSFNTTKAQTPRNNRKIDSLRLDSLLKKIPDSVKKEIADYGKKSLARFNKYNSLEASKSKTDFENNMAAALNLKLVVRDTDFKFSRLHIFGDTLFGDYDHIISNKEYREYFIQSLTDTSHLVKFNNSELSYYTTTTFDSYHDGCIYFNYGSTMKTLCSDGKITEIFPKYQDMLNYTYKIILYKNRAILIRTKDISEFDIRSQNLIWKYDIPKNASVYSLLKGDTLFFSTWINKAATVVAYNIEKQSIIWKKVFEEDLPRYSHSIYDADYLLFQDNNTLVLPTKSTCYILNMNTGNVTGKVTWQIFFGEGGEYVFFKINNNDLFIDDFANNQKTIKCIDFGTNKIKWELKDAYFIGLYKQYVVAYTSGQKYYLIIDKSTGIIKSKIPAPISNIPEFDFIGNYILINEFAIYK